jgi:hypothetical protein
MGNVIYQLLVPVIVGFGAALLGAYLTKRWTPDPRPEFKELGDGLKTELETLERERSERENLLEELAHLPLEVQLVQAVPQAYIAVVKSGSAERVDIGPVNLECDGVRLSTPAMPRDGEDWSIEPHGGKRITWSPSPDPVRTLRSVRPTFRAGNTTPIQFRLTYRVRGRTYTRRFTATASIDINNSYLDVISPFS